MLHRPLGLMRLLELASLLVMCWSPWKTSSLELLQLSGRGSKSRSRALAVLQRRQPDASQVDPSYPQRYSPCSCDCCLVASRSQAEIVTIASGETLVRKCVSPPPAYQTEVCTDRCTPAADVVLTSASSDMDYSRYCNYKCRPSGMTVGTLCEPLGAKEIEGVFNMDGNGNDETSAFIPMDSSETGWGSASSGASAATARASAEASATTARMASSVKEHVKYDMRKVIMERYRAEAAANIARASAEEAWSQANKERATHASEETAKVAAALDPTSGSAGENSVAAKTAATQAQADAGTTRRVLAEVRVAAAGAAKAAMAAAQAAIPGAVAQAAKEEAEADAFNFGWDKPPNWDKVIAVTMSEPYLKAMVQATWRASEYNSFSRGVQGQAKGARAKAAGLNRQANQYEAMGDNIKTKLLRHEIQGLIGQSAKLEAEAKNYWNVANRAQNSITEYQKAGGKAANHAGWLWHLTFTPSPEFGR